MKSVTLHIGLPKTGTSAIQSFLAANRSLLPFSYPPGPQDARAAKGKSTPGNGAAIAKLLAQRQHDEAVELAQDGALYSSERFSGLNTPVLAAYVRRLEAKVVCYVRPQVEGLIAGYGQVTKTEQFQGDFRAFVERHKRRAFLGARLQPLRKISDVVLRTYDRSAMVNNDIVDDFFDAIGVAVPVGAKRFEGVNVAKQKPEVDLALLEEIAAHYRVENDKLDEMFGRSFGLNAANDKALEKFRQG